MAEGRDNICRRLSLRQVDASTSLAFQRDFFGCRAQIDRLGLEGELKGHASCVNCLEWNRTGTLLASGSDDQKAIIWDAEAKRVKLAHNTGHDGNIFSVKFLPFSNDNLLATAAADSEVRLHDLQRREILHEYRCNNRVKRLATAPDTPHMFWSGAEDGTIRRYDMREPAEKQSSTLVHLPPHFEVKCIAINPIRTHLLAAGCSDPYVRVFDLRKLVPVAAGSPYAFDAPLHYFCPGHLNERATNRRRMKRYRQFAVTYVAWSPDGRELLTNLGAEQVYLYDTLDLRRALYLESFEAIANTSKDESIIDLEVSAAAHAPPMPKRAYELKSMGNAAFNEQQYSRAIYLYSKAMIYGANQPVFYANRAAAYLKRSWCGDVYAALRDCYTSLSLDPSNYKAHLRQANCLHQLKWHQLALDSIRRFQQQFPNMSHKSGSLAKKIEEEATKASGKSQSENGASNSGGDGNSSEAADSLERKCQLAAIDFKTHFCGHCNTTTDIKEVSFIGGRSQYVAAGSDDGRFFIWDKTTGKLVRVLRGDDAIVNCIQPHPYRLVLATSGIDPLVRLWSPRASHDVAFGIDDTCAVTSDRDLSKIAGENQKRMRADPLELMLLNMGMRLGEYNGSDDEGDDEEGRRIQRPHGCQPS